MPDSEPTVINTGERSSGAGWFVAILLLLVIAGGGFYLYNGGFGGEKKAIDVEVTLPDATPKTE
ncbi:MAG: hypothetical protein JJ891_01700 [Rhizobiaceae bacterium]|nr:hypothetical protein [Rhizobiaceae bacterium]